jgi:hypothetical protein
MGAYADEICEEAIGELMNGFTKAISIGDMLPLSTPNLLSRHSSNRGGSFSVSVTQITDHEVQISYSARKGWAVEQPTLMTAIAKLVVAGEQAGFTVEQMIQLLETGASVEALLDLIELRLFHHVTTLRSSRWVM